MSKARLIVLVAALTMGAVAPRLAAQDTSSQARPDTSAYTGGAGVDTSARAGMLGATDTVGGAGDSATTDSATTDSAATDSAATDSAATNSGAPAGVGEQRPLEPRQPVIRLGDSPPPADSTSVPQPTPQPGKNTSGTSEPHDSV
jgi:hypothetical protein